MPVTWTRIETGQPRRSLAQIKGDLDAAIAERGAEAVAHIQGTIWAISRFRRPTGLSTRSWFHARADWNGHAALVVDNSAINRYGTKYPKYVHLAGRPKSEKLMAEVRDYLLGPVARSLAADAAAAITTRAASVTKTTRIGG